jgi:hypothetical protein
MSIKKYLNQAADLQKELEAKEELKLAAVSFDSLMVESDALATASEENITAVSALEQLDALQSSLEQVVEIEDNKTAQITLTAILSNNAYAMLRPSFEAGEESDAKGDAKGIIKKLVEAAVAIVKSIIKSLRDFIVALYDKTLKMNRKAIAFNAKVKTLKGEPKQDKVTLGASTKVLFTDKGLDLSVFNDMVYKSATDAFTDAVAIADAAKTVEGSKYDEIMDLVKKTVSRYKTEGEVKEVAAMKVADIVKGADALVKDTDAILKGRKIIFESAIVKSEKAVAALEKSSDATKEQIELVKLHAKVVNASSKEILTAVYTVHLAKFTALIEFAKNIKGADAKSEDKAKAELDEEELEELDEEEAKKAKKAKKAEEESEEEELDEEELEEAKKAFLAKKKAKKAEEESEEEESEEESEEAKK